MAQGAGHRHTASTAQAQRWSSTATGPEELVGGPSRQSGLQPRQRLESGCQGARQVSPPAGRQPISDSTRLPVCDIYENHRPTTAAATDNQPDWTVTSQLLSVRNHWKTRKERDPKSLSQPLRTVLLSLLRFDTGSTSSRASQLPRRLPSTILENDHFPYMQWNPEESRHVKVDQAPLSIEEALQVLAQLQQLIIHPNTVGRFHPLRKLTPEMASDVISWTLEIQNRTQEAQAVYQLVGRLARSGVTHLVSSTLRPSKLGCSPLATAVDKMLQEL